MYLPGEIHERIGDLRSSKGLSQKELSVIIGIVPSQLSRIESGKIQNISSDILIKLAKAFGVSTDYILGLTTVSTPKSYDISELGLSEGTVRGLVTGTIEVEILNQLMEHKTFPYLLYLVKTFFNNRIADGIKNRNAIIDMATATLGDFAKDNPKYKEDLRADAKYLKSQKLTDHETEIEKIKSTFVAILKDIKKDSEDGKATEPSASAELLQTMREQVQAAQQGQKSINAEDMADIVANMVGKVLPLDEMGTAIFKQLAEHLFTEHGENDE